MTKEGHNKGLNLKVEWKNTCILTWSLWKGENENGDDGHRERESFPELRW